MDTLYWLFISPMYANIPIMFPPHYTVYQIGLSLDIGCAGDIIVILVREIMFIYVSYWAYKDIFEMDSC